MEELNAMIDKESYIESKGLACPFCGSESIQGGFIEIQAAEAYQEMGCRECERNWHDVYRLVDVMPEKSEE
jgi:formate dehydrogenase maturation protein FdhE